MALTKVSFDLLKDALHWVAAATNITVVNADGIMADTTAGAFTVTLPIAPNVGDRIGVKDAGSSFGTNNLTIAGNGNNVDGATTLVLSSDVSLIIQYNGVEWKSESALGGSGSGTNVGEFIEAGATFTHPNFIGVTSSVRIDRALYPDLSNIYPGSGVPSFEYSATALYDVGDAYSDTAIEVLPSNRVVKVDVSGQTTGVLTARYSDDDGATWTVATTPPTALASYGGFANGRCLGICLIGATIHLYMQDAYLNIATRYTTTDGITWTVADAPAATTAGMTSGWYSATYNPTIDRVILAGGGNYYISAVGNYAISSFTVCLTAANNYGSRAITVAPDGSFLASQNGFNVYRSTDGVSWSQTLAPLTNVIANFVVAPNSVDVLLSDRIGNVYRSTDNGLTWTNVTTSNGGYVTLLWPDYVNGVIVSGSYLSQTISLDNGVTWTYKTTTDTTLLMSAASYGPTTTIKWSANRSFADGQYASARNAANLAYTVNLGPTTPAAGYKTYVKIR